MPQHSRQSFWDLTGFSDLQGRFIADAVTQVPFARLAQAASHTGLAAGLRRQSVLVATKEQLIPSLALLALDGIARRIVLCPPDVAPAHMPYIMATAEVDAIISDQDQPIDGTPSSVRFITARPTDLGPVPADRERVATEWILFTSGTTGAPKMVVHTLETLTGPVERILTLGAGAVWSTFYDIRRYGGLQMLLRALVGGGTMVLSSPGEAVSDYLGRVAAHRVTHISGTPSHWRRALMSPMARELRPRYVRMSGEVADQPIIDKLRAFFPDAVVAHAFASTEAGLAFDVNDGLAGFPAHLVTEVGPTAAIRIQDGSLRIRSNRTALRYLGQNAPRLADDEGFIDTGDVIECRGDRYFFAGRKEGIINVGGLKVHPEEVEAIINQHPDVEMSLVKPRANPITGAIVVAEVVRKAVGGQPVETSLSEANKLKEELLVLCRKTLPPYKVPASIRVVSALNVGVSGKLARVRS
jgi:acyl-coenzyme A synthetase/AMP-(fatty) acid ligase